MKNKQSPLVRAFWNDAEYHRQIWREENITIVITQSKKLDIIKLTLSSLLRFYPDIPILVVNNIQDDPTWDGDPSSEYLHYLEAKIPNLTIFDRSGLNSHGVSMDEAIRYHVNTKYVLTMDSDIIVERGDWIEMLIDQIERNNLYASGTLMLVSRKNDSCGAPLDKNDILRHIHASCAIYKREIYLKLRPFVNHGAACCYNMLDAEANGYKVGYFPIEKYVSHLTGSSWCAPRTIWPDDHGVFSRPFITFIINSPDHFYVLNNFNDHDFDAITFGKHITTEVIMHDGEPKKDVSNKIYDLRHRVTGDYVCYLINNMDVYFIEQARKEVTMSGHANEVIVGDTIIYKREWWQYKYVF